MNKSHGFFLLFLVIIYVPIAYFGLASVHDFDDENIYFYKTKLVAEGVTPYKEFFLGHPPVFIYLSAAMFKLFGATYPAFKIIPLISSFMLLTVVYLAGEHAGKKTGLTACLLILAYSQRFHNFNHYNRGIMLATLLAFTAAYLHVAKKRFPAGIAIALACATRLNCAPILIYLAYRSLKEKDKKFFYGMVATAPLLLIVLTPNFIEQVILFNMNEDPEPIQARLYYLTLFLYQNLPTTILFLAGAYVTWKKRENKVFIALPVFFIAFSFLFQRRFYAYYFLMITPYLVAVAAIGLKAVLGSGRKIAAGATLVLLACYFIFISAPAISAKYVSYQSEAVNEAAEYVMENTAEGDSILFIQEVGGPEIALRSGRPIAGHFVDPSIHRLYASRESVNETILAELMDKPALVSLEPRTVQDMLDMGVDVKGFMDYLGREYVPDKIIYSPGGFLNTFILWKPKDAVEPGRIQYAAPSGEDNAYYLERYFMPAEGSAIMEDNVFEGEGQVSQPRIPKTLTGENPFNVKLILGSDIMKWPAEDNVHYRLVDGEYESWVWIGINGEGMMNVFVLTWWEGNIISLTRMRYDYEHKIFSGIDCHSRLSIPISNIFYKTYQQVPVTGGKYKAMEKLIGEQKEGRLSWEDYRMLSSQALSGI
ncbi:MAG: hypothetical protein ABH834_01525 [Candidatus Altiarchaeota archaeon]